MRKDIENAFANCSVCFEQEERLPHFYDDCSVVRQGALMTFNVSIYDIGAGEHLVDIEHMSGCRFAFSEAASDLARQMQFCSSGAFSQKTAMPACPPPAGPAPSAVSVSSAKTTTAALAANDAAACAKNLLGMLSQHSSFEHKLQATRAAGALATSVHQADGSAIQDLFADRQWMDVVDHVTALASKSDNAPSGAISAQQSDEIQVVAMATLANFAALGPDWCGAAQINDAALDAIIKGVQDENHHLRREALRATVDVAPISAAKLVRGGIVPHLERLAGGADDGECEDAAAAKFAKFSLVACRA